MTVDIDKLTYQELLELNHRVVARLKFLDSMHAHAEMMSFNPGARVSFDSPQGRKLGTLVKFNRKTVTVITDDHHQWNVAPVFLSRVIEPPSATRAWRATA